MTREEAVKILRSLYNVQRLDTLTQEEMTAVNMAIKALKQEPCEVCEWFEQYVDIANDIVELRFSDGTVKRAKRGLYMRDIEKSIRKMLIDQIANEKKTDTLDKIRAELIEEKECAYADFERYKVEYLGQDWGDVYDSLPQDDFRYGMERAVELIDKYKTESEEKTRQD